MGQLKEKPTKRHQPSSIIRYSFPRFSLSSLISPRRDLLLILMLTLRFRFPIPITPTPASYPTTSTLNSPTLNILHCLPLLLSLLFLLFPFPPYWPPSSTCCSSCPRTSTPLTTFRSRLTSIPNSSNPLGSVKIGRTGLWCFVSDFHGVELSEFGVDEPGAGEAVDVTTAGKLLGFYWRLERR